MSDLKPYINELFDLVLDCHRNNHDNKIELFDQYKEKMKIQNSEALNDYLTSIQHGYELIISELDSRSTIH